MNMIKKIYENTNLKRKMATVLCVVMLVQTVIGGTIPTLAEPIVGETTSPILYDIRDKSNPASAFSELNLTFGNQVGDSNNLFMKFQGKLNQIWAGEQYEQYLITGMDESTWEREDKSGTYKTYAEFLDARSDSELQEISFTCRLSNSESVFEIGNGLTASLQTDRGETIGSYTIAQDKEDVVLTCKLLRSMYYTSKLEFGFTMFLNFSKNYQSGTPITVVPGTNGSDFIVTPDPSGEEIPKDTGYSIKKTAKQEGTTGIVYTIEAELAATASDATSSDATSSDATSSDATSSDATSSDATSSDATSSMAFSSSAGRASASNPDGQNNLIGKVITDQIPEGLVITSITSTIDTFEPASVYPAQPGESSSCTVANNLITYTVPALASGIVETVKLEIHTRLSDVFYNEYMKKGTAVELSFPNKAFLKGDNTTLAISNRVIPKLKLVAPFNKEGYPLDSSNKSFRWTLSVNSQFSASSSVALYAVDHIADIKDTHDYRIQDGITIKPGTGTEIHKGIIKGELPSDVDASAYTYEKLIGIAKIEEVIKTLYPKELPSGYDNDAIMYTYPVDQNQTDAVMLIPLTGFTNQEVKISYITDAVIPDYANLDQAPKQLKNNAKILWRWNHGEGITPGEEVGGASINKIYPVSYSLVNKTAAPYNDKENTITWSFEVNQLAVDQIHSMDITDQFDNTELRLTGMKTPGGGTWAPLTLTPVKGIGNATESNARRVPYWDGTESSKPTGDYYQITESAATGTNPTTTFKLHLTELRGTDHYRFSLETEVLKLDSSSDNNYMNIQNKAHVEAVIDKTSVKFDTTADCRVKNTIIRKWTIPTEGNEYYDYRDNTVKWRITINPHSRVLHEAVLTDRLPSGIQLASWTGVGVGTEITAGSIPQKGEGGTWTVTLPQKGATTATTMTLAETDIQPTDLEYDHKSNGHPQKRLEFRFSDSQASPSDAVLAEPVTVEFTTTIAETYRKEKFKSTGVEITLKNKATLTGKVDGSSNVFTASDTAENRIKPLPMIKSGIYKKNQSVPMNGSQANLTVIDWSLLVNRTCMDIGGATLSDAIPNCMELLPDTMKVAAVKLKTNGMIDEAIPPVLVYEATSSDASGFNFRAADGTGTAMNEYGFSCTIPSDKPVTGDGSFPWKGAKVQTSTLRFTFRTVMVNDAYAADITNKASLQINGITDTTSNADVTGKSDFNTADYATAEGVYFTKIYKTTVNASQIYPLDQTKFKIEKLITPGDGSGSAAIADWNQVDTHSTEKIRTTNAKGTLTFMFMKPGAMYRITETEPHFGYARPDDVWFVVIKDLKPGKTGVTYPEPDDNADGTKKITMGDKEVPYHLYIHDASAANPNYKILEIKNKINETISGNGMISFVKRGHNGQLLPGVKFTLSHRLFAPKATMSDAFGKVTFDQVDPNDEYYTISEKTPQGYRSLTQPLQVKLTLEKNGGNPVSKVEFKKNGAYTESTGTELGTLSNTPITGSGSFKKVDQNGTAILTPIQFKVTRRGDGGQVLGGSSTPSQPIVIDVDAPGAIDNHTADKYYEYLPQQTITTSQGIATFTDYPYGDYCFEEVTSETVLLVPTETLKQVYVHIDETGVWASDHCESPTGKVPDGTGGGKKLTVSDGMAYQVTNRLQYGFVQIHKVVGEKHVDGTIIPLTHGSKPPIPLSGVKFDIYRDMNSNKVIDQGDTKVISNLSTDADGKFVIDPCVPTSYKKSYQGTKVQLTTGHYILQEQSQNGFETKSTIYPFEIPSWGSAKEPTTVYVGDSTVTSGQEAQQLLYNVPLRKPVSLKKTDSFKADKLLSNAEFEVYATNKQGEETLVAYLVEATSSDATQTGRYILSDHGSTGGTVEEKNATEISYLRRNPTVAEGGNSFELLQGIYNVKETLTPTNYQPLGAQVRFQLTIDSKGAAVSGTPDIVSDSFTIKNTLITQTIRIKKFLETLDVNQNGANHKGYALEAGFEFKLTGTSYNGAPVDFTATTDGTNDITFADIPVGTYTLSEVDVPNWCKSSAKGTISWAVEPMPDVAVEVTPKGVNYSIAGTTTGTTIGTENTIPANSNESDRAGTTVYHNREKDAVLIARNNYSFGRASGTKVGTLNVKDLNRDVTLSNATFTLKNGGSGSNSYTFTATSTSDGCFAFQNIPYGNYTLTETGVPSGYKKTKSIQVPIYQPVVSLQNTTDGKFLNEVMLKSVKFKKVDQNGDALGSNRVKTTFRVERVATPSDMALPAFSPQTTVVNDANGVVTIDNLTYGTYKVTETEAVPAMVCDSPLPSFYIRVGSGTSGKSKVELGSNVQMTAPVVSMEQEDYINSVYNTNAFDFSNANKKSTYYALQNTLKYGMVQINKVLGERDSNGNLVVVTLEQNAIPIPGATFSVFHAVNGTKNGSAVMTLTTDTAGHFPINSDGSYTVNGKKRFLLCGDYILEEVSVPSDYVKKTKSYPFTITPGRIGSDKTYQPTETVVGSNDSNTTHFINEPVRGTVKLKKVDTDHPSKELKDAVFAVYTQTEAIYVANLTYQTDGYKLAAIGKGISPKKGNLEYLHQDGKVYKLLKGTYDLIEITAPTLSDGTTGGNSYPLPTNPVGTFEIGTNNQIIDKLTGNRDITNTIIKHSFTLQKKVEQWQVEGNTGKHKDYSADSSGFQFTLSGTAANGATTEEGMNQSYVVSGTTNANGTYVFSGVPVGSYTLSETGVGSVYQFAPNSSKESVTRMSDISVKVTAAGITFTRENMALGATTEDTSNKGIDSVSGTGDGQIVTVYNKLKIGSITGMKVGVGNIATGSVALPNATFGLYKNGNTNPYATTTTTEQSNTITFSNIPFGDYYVKEITAPVGYMKYTEVSSVTVDNESQATFILKESNGNEQLIENKLILKSLKLRKVDQNGVPLGTDRLKAQFSITKTDSNPTIPATIYTVPDNLSNDANGVISIPDLAYGTYEVREQLTESESEKVDNGTSAVLPVFYIRVEAADAPKKTTHTKITVSNYSSFSASQSGNVTRSITMSNTDSAIYDFSDTAKSSTLFTVINRMKYGTIAINKVSAEKDGPIGATPTYSGQKALAGATFDIYKGSNDKDIKPENLILTLQTDAFGHFPTADADGTYTDSITKKRVILLAGSYLLKEVSAPTTDYTILTGAIPFTITDKSQMVTFYYEGTGKGTSTNIDATASFTEKFYNVIPRGTISFKKVASDNDETVVHGAVFGLVSQNPGVNHGKVVAFITEDGGEQSHTGTYRLTETTEELKRLLPLKYAYAGSCGVIPYVRKDSTPSTVCKVLPGTYKLVELKTGDDYVLPTGDANIIVPSLVVKDGENTALGINGQITNTLKTADITIRKQIEDFAVGTYQDYTRTPADKFEFTLTGTTVSGTTINPQIYTIGATGFSSGEVKFTNIPVGQYKLKETGHPDNYYDMKPVEFSFNVQNDGTVIASPSDAMLNSSSSNPKNTYSIGNQVKRNIIYGKKVTTLGGEDYPVKGAVFGLFDHLGHELTSESSGTRATSAADGTFKFENIPWLMDVNTERYYIKEVTTPDGYAVNSTQYPITVSAQVMDQSQTSQVEITHQNPLRINNTSIPIAVKLKKIDQNGNSVKFSKIPLTFTLTQMADGQDPVSGFAVTAKNAEDGSITFSNLRYGSYKLTESPSDYVIDEETESAEVRIEPGTNSQTKVTITYKGKTQSIEQSTSVSESNCYDFTQKKDVAMVNEVNYGLIQINKIIGKVNRDGTLTPVEEAGKSKPLAGVQFKVYVDSDEDGAATPSECTDDKAVLTLVTDAEGHFAVNENHQYMNGSQAQEYRLLYGEHYLLREISAPEGYAVSTAIYPFNMTGLAKVGETIYMGADPDDKNIDLGSLSSGNGDIRVSSEQTCVFPNGSPYRGKIELMKLDREEPKRYLLGAEFDVYATIIDRKIGRLTDLAIKGSYQLVRGDTGYTTYDPSGQPYLHEEQGELMLLPGSYYLVETKAPTGYILPSSAERWYFELENKPNEVIGNTDLRADQTPQATDKILDNQIAKHEVAIQKYVQEKLHTVTYHTANAADHLTEIEFLLEGKTINQEKYEVRKSLSAEMDAAGTVRFEDVPSGTYTLTELNIPNQYVIPASITVTVGVDGVTYNDSGIASQPVRLNNDLKRGAIQGIKKSNRGILLPGAEIGLFPSTTTVFTEENLYSGLKSISNNEGIFRFDHILCGDYLVAELQAPNGYRLNTTTSYLVHITEQGQVVTIGDKKIQNVGTKPVVEPAVEILIINDKKSSHGGDDPTTSPTKPTEPTLPTDPTQPTAPTLPTDPTDQTTPELPTIPANPTDPAKPDLPPGTIIEIPDSENPAGPPLYVGPYDPDHRYTGFPPGDYEMVTIDSDGSPLAKFHFHIDENGTPLAIIPKVGDSSVPTAALAVILIVSLAGVGIIWKRKREDKESHE